MQIMGLPANVTVEMTGGTNLTKRKEMWECNKAFFLTPQVVANDLVNDICDAVGCCVCMYASAFVFMCVRVCIVCVCVAQTTFVQTHMHKRACTSVMILLLLPVCMSRAWTHT